MWEIAYIQLLVLCEHQVVFHDLFKTFFPWPQALSSKGYPDHYSAEYLREPLSYPGQISLPLVFSANGKPNLQVAQAKVQTSFNPLFASHSTSKSSPNVDSLTFKIYLNSDNFLHNHHSHPHPSYCHLSWIMSIAF